MHLSFTVEWGTEFQPVFAEMQEIIKDVTSGLIGLGLKALGLDSYIVTNRDTFSSYEVETVLAYPESFYVIYDGFSPASLGLPGATPAIRFLTAINGGVISFDVGGRDIRYGRRSWVAEHSAAHFVHVSGELYGHKRVHDGDSRYLSSRRD